jgi:hypothetical protein
MTSTPSRKKLPTGLKLALDFGPSLSDEDIRATTEDAESYIASRNAIRLRPAH